MSNFLKHSLISLALAFAFGACAGTSIFVNIPLTLDPLVLANPIALASSPTSNRLYVVNSNNRVLWFDASFIIMDITNPARPVALAVISIANFSGQIILDEARGFVYIPDRQSGSAADEQDQILRININEASPFFLDVEFIDATDNPFGAWFTGQFLFVAAIADALQYNVDTFTGFTKVDLAVTTNTGRELDAERTRELAVTPSGNNLFVTNRLDNMLIINMGQFSPPVTPGLTDLGQEPVDYILTGTQSTRGITTGSTFTYVVDGAPQALRILTDDGLAPVSGAPVEIPLSSLEVAAIPVGFNPSEVIFDEPNQRAYVTNTGEDTVSVIDTNLRQEIARIDVNTTGETVQSSGDGNLGDQPSAMTLVNIGGTNFLYVAHFTTNLISIINADTLSTVGMFPLPLP